MANQRHRRVLEQGVLAWNTWQVTNILIKPDLRGAILERDYLENIDFTDTNLTEANLKRARLRGAIFCNTILVRANLAESSLTWSNFYNNSQLSYADLSETDLEGARFLNVKLDHCKLVDAQLTYASFINVDLKECDLFGAQLAYTVFFRTDFKGANLENASLYETVFIDCNLTDTYGLDRCHQLSHNSIDHRTLAQSLGLQPEFLKGSGLPDSVLNSVPAIQGNTSSSRSLFISYSSKDEEFAEQLYSGLQKEDITCWYAPKDLRIGDNWRDAIDQAIHERETVLLILSVSSVNSSWVEKEVKKAFALEEEKKRKVLFPIRLDEAVLGTDKSWAREVRDNRHIGDFCAWEDEEAYNKAFEILVRDLKAT